MWSSVSQLIETTWGHVTYFCWVHGLEVDWGFHSVVGWCRVNSIHFWFFLNFFFSSAIVVLS
jgi:hypothetical protein